MVSKLFASQYLYLNDIESRVENYCMFVYCNKSLLQLNLTCLVTVFGSSSA